MSRAAMLGVSAATAGILIAGTTAAISVVNAVQTAPVSHTIPLLTHHITPAQGSPPAQGNSPGSEHDFESSFPAHDHDGDDD